MASKIIYFGHITSYGESGFNSSGAVPAVELAVEHVNNNTSILAGYKLVSTPVMDSECDHIKSLDAFFLSVVYATSRYNVIALLGCGCGVATEPVAEISHRWNITQISYASGSSILSNRAQFKNYFRTWPSFKDIAPGLVSILKHYNWTRVSFLTQKENLFTSNLSQYLELYNQRQKLENYSDTVVHAFAYDAIWALALALNKTEEQIKTNISIPDCQGLNGYINITLDQFQYSNAKMSCYLKANLQATNFTGVTGAVQFDSNGTRVNHKLSILQYRIDGSNLVKKCIGYINLDQNATYPFYDDCNETSLSAFPKGIPLDGTPLNVTSTSNFAMSITYFVLASTGIILVLVCGAFNLIFSNTTVVRLTSPNLNYFILIGALLLYSGMYSNIVLTTAGSVRTVQCHFQTWLVFLGYAFVLGTVIAKLWRVYHIFHNPTTAKQPIHDWNLIILVLALSGIQIFLLFLGSAVPVLQPKLHLIQNAENPVLIEDSQYGLTVYYYIPICFQKDTPSYYWLILLMTYTAFLQCLGMILAFQTRKVKVSALNDSKYVAATIYISSITLLTLLFTHFGFYDYANISYGIVNGIIFVSTTAYLGLIFCPKMISLYKDPDGSNIFKKSFSVKEGVKIGATTINIKESFNMKESPDTMLPHWWVFKHYYLALLALSFCFPLT
ncbi:hypothetical protein EMCRGX_G014948 [Ephydatia muelleri]